MHPKSLQRLALTSVAAGLFLLLAHFDALFPQNESSLRRSLDAGEKRRPVIYTFFELVEGGHGDDVMIEPWKKAWAAAGWIPRVIDLAVVRRHRDYPAFVKALDKIPLGSNTEYDKLCYLRWLAMSAVGGGWMSDPDVFPLWPESVARSDRNLGSAEAGADSLPGDGKLTVYAGTRHAFFYGPEKGAEIPCLVSGSARSFNEMAHELLMTGLRHTGTGLFSDMHALQSLTRDPRREDLDLSFDVRNEVVPGQVAFELMDNFDISDSNATIEITCEKFKSHSRRAVHFSHASFGTGPARHQRSTYPLKWLAKWTEVCVDNELFLSGVKGALVQQRK